MTKPPSNLGEWDIFWRGSQSSQPPAECTDNPEILNACWIDFFNTKADLSSGFSLLDLASGGGAILNAASKSRRKQSLKSANIFCLDYSPAAMVTLKQRFPDAKCVVSDCLATPFPLASFDLVVSQFGVEYAGLAAINRAAGLVATGGALCFHMHIRQGAIFEECSANADLASSILSLGVLPAAKAAFRACAEFEQKAISQASLTSNQEAFSRVIRSLEERISENGVDAAGGLLAKLYDSLGHLFRRRTAFETNDLIKWCDDFEFEIGSYIARMEAMKSAALSEKQIAKVIDGFELAGLRQDKDGTHLLKDKNDPVAMRILFHRP